MKWVDGMQNIADVLTKANTDKETLRIFMQDGMMNLVQSDENKAMKEKKRPERQRRNEKSEKPQRNKEANFFAETAACRRVEGP